MNNTNLLYDVPEWADEDLDVLAVPIPEDAPQPIARPEGVDVNDFVTRLVFRVLNLRAEAEAIDARVKELQTRKAARVNAEEFLRKRILGEMQAAGVQKIKHAEFTASVTERGMTLEVTDLDKLPIAFVRVKREPNKTAINAAFKETGEVVPGTEIRDGGSSLTLRFK